MSAKRPILIPMLVGALAATAAVYWLWQDYAAQGAALQRIVETRGETALASLEAGIRSHGMMGRWFYGNIETVLEAAAQPEGILGISIFDESGQLLGHGGQPFEGPTTASDEVAEGTRLTGEGFVVVRKATLKPLRHEGTGRAGGMGWGRMGGAGRGEERDLPESVWMAVLLDPTEHAAMEVQRRRRFVLSLAVTLTAFCLAVATLALLQRQAALASELTVAKERQKRFEERSELGAGLAHETKNPLGLIRGMAQRLSRVAAKTDGDAREALCEAQETGRRVVDEVDRVVSRVNSFLEYARAQEPQRAPFDLAETIRDTTVLFADEAAAKGVELRCQLDPASVEADEAMTRQILVNLLANALAACDRDDEIVVGLEEDGRRRVTLTVRDTGVGIAAADLPQVVHPYFTCREGGAGLGLAIVDQIAQSHGWRLRLESAPGEGTTARIESIAVRMES